MDLTSQGTTSGRSEFGANMPDDRQHTYALVEVGKKFISDEVLGHSFYCQKLTRQDRRPGFRTREIFLLVSFFSALFVSVVVW